VRYLFDPRTGLCALRLDLGSGDRTHYADWRTVDGIATAFVETLETRQATIEDRVLGVAYDLALPDTLFRMR
jgi:hypothetical protein